MKDISNKDLSKDSSPIQGQSSSITGTLRVLQYIKRHRYYILSGILLAVTLLQFLYGKWVGDFWEHSSVVRELASHPLNPQHPLLLVDVSHPFFSPYLLVVGLLARIFALDAVTALTIAGVFNLLFLLFSLRLFIHRLFKEQQDTVAFYALTFILFLWPAEAWNWSGFLHFKVLGYVLPYPSTFAMATSLLIFAVYFRALSTHSIVRLAAVTLLTATVIITHPNTAVIAFIGIGAITLHFWPRIGFKAPAMGTLLMLGAILLAIIWPYYSFLDLLAANSPDFHTDSYRLYERFYLIWPSLLLLPLATITLWSRWQRNHLDALVLIMAAATLVYLFGFISGQYGFGRIISFIAILIQISAAAFLVQLEQNRERQRLLRYLPLMVWGLLVSLAFNSHNLSAVERSLKGLQGIRYDYSQYQTLSRHITQYEVVLSDIESSWMIPTFGGKIIASKHPAHWVDDHAQRVIDVDRFFAADVNITEKSETIDKYEVDFILIDKNRIAAPDSYFEFGDLLFEGSDFLLLEVKTTK